MSRALLTFFYTYVYQIPQRILIQPFYWNNPHRRNLISRKLRESLVQTPDSCEWRSVKRRACANSTSDRTADKNDSCKVWGTYVPNVVKIGPQITSHSCPQTPDGRTDGRTDGRLRDFIFCPMHMHSIGQTIKRAQSWLLGYRWCDECATCRRSLRMLMTSLSSPSCW